MEKKRILFVCLGNMCRSPMAEAIGRALGGDRVECESAGVAAWPGEGASRGAVEVIREKYGIDLSTHRPRHTRDMDMGRYAAVVVLDRQAMTDINRRCKGTGARIVEAFVDDPYGEPKETFQRVMGEIRAIIEGMPEFGGKA